MQNAMTNPFTWWQDTMKNSMQMMSPAATPSMPQMDFTNPMQMMQQSMQFWQSMLQPQTVAPAMQNNFPSPKITVATIELGDMTPYIKPAMEMMNQWHKMWLQGMGGR